MLFDALRQPALSRVGHCLRWNKSMHKYRSEGRFNGLGMVFANLADFFNASIQPTPSRTPPFDQASLPFVAIAISNDALVIGGAARADRHH
jgi:hypothetical protein